MENDGSKGSLKTPLYEIKQRTISIYDNGENRLYFIPAIRIHSLYISDLKFSHLQDKQYQIMFDINFIIDGLEKSLGSMVRLNVISEKNPSEDILEYTKGFLFDEVKKCFDALLYHKMEFEPRSESFKSIIENNLMLSEKLREHLKRFDIIIGDSEGYITLL